MRQKNALKVYYDYIAEDLREFTSALGDAVELMVV